MRERAQDCRHACRQPEDGVRFSGFDQVFIRVERRPISRKVKKLYFLLVGLNPALNDTRVVDPRVVANNEKFSSVAPEIKDKTVQKPDEVIGIDGFALQ